MRTTVSPAVQRAAVTALGGQLGGIVAMAPATGQILAVAGIGLDDLQPPGSTFKMVTLTGVLQRRHRQPAHRLPLRDLRDARRRQAEQRQRRGMRRHARTRVRGLVQLGVRAARASKLGATRLVATAERYGFNHSPGRPGRGRKHAAAGVADPGRTRRRLDRDRPGRGAGERAGDGDRRRHDRRRRAPAPADLRSAAAPPPARARS